MSDPANRTDRPGGGKIYIHPVTNEVFDSVTTVLDIFDKAGLKRWAGMVAADFAMDSLPQLMGSILVPPCGNTFNRCYLKHGRQNWCERCPCGDCEKCWWRRVAWRHEAESSRRAQEGTECHQAIDFWVLNGGGRVSLRPEVEPYFDTFLRWVADYGLEPNNQPGVLGSWEQTEVTLLNREHMYAGTSDGAIWLYRGRTAATDALLEQIAPGRDKACVRLDYKTREKPDERLYFDMPLQGIAYEMCDVAMLPSGEEHDAPRTDARALLQLRPGDYSFRLMLSDAPEFKVFLGLLAAYKWMTGEGKKWWEPRPEQKPVVVQQEPAKLIEAEVLELAVLADPIDLGVQPDPWPDPELAWLSTDLPIEEPILEELPSLPSPPAKTAAARHPDPFAAHSPKQRKMDAAAGPTLNHTLASIDARFDPGPPQKALFDDDIPF